MTTPDDLGDVPFLHDAERAEVQWLLARERDPGAPAPSPEIAAEYAELEALLASLPADLSDVSWHADVLRAVSASGLPSRPRRRTAIFRWAIGGALAAAAAVIVLMLLPRAPEPPDLPAHAQLPQLEVAIRHVRATRSDPDDAVVGDHLVVTARPRELGDLRVYRADGALVARCPGGPGCRAGSHGEQTIEITLDRPLQYRVILVDGLRAALPDGSIDAYVSAARTARADIQDQAIDVH